MSKPKLVYAVEMLHYLPLFIAHERHLQDKLDIELAAAPHGDKVAIDRLLSNSSEDTSVDFCVCDPMVVSLQEAYSAIGAERPVVIGQLINRVPFWAVNHERKPFHALSGFRGYTQIWAYPSPNTGSVFGRLVYNAVTSPETEISLRDKQIDADLAGCIPNQYSVAIEADMLKIKKFTEATKYNVVYSFPQDSQYNDFCFTALLTRKKVLDDPAGRALALDILRALTEATDLIYTFQDHACIYAARRFALNSPHYNERIVSGALSDLIKDRVFSNTPVVSSLGWNRSAKVRESTTQPPDQFLHPSFRTCVDNSLAGLAYSGYIRKKLPSTSNLLIDLARVRRIAAGVLGTLFTMVLYAWPLALVAPKLKVPSGWLNPWIWFHVILTSVIVVLYFWSEVLTLIRLNPKKVEEWTFPIAIAYAVSEGGIVPELIRFYDRLNP